MSELHKQSVGTIAIIDNLLAGLDEGKDSAVQEAKKMLHRLVDNSSADQLKLLLVPVIKLAEYTAHRTSTRPEQRDE